MSTILSHMAGWIDSIPETQDDWWAKVRELANLHHGAGWKLARWISWGMDEYKISAEDLAIQLDRAEQTIRNYHSVMHNHAATIAANYGLSVSHAVEVLGLSPTEQEEWLFKCHEERWSTLKLRAELRAVRVATLGQVAATPPAPVYPQCYQCREEGRSADATRVGVSGRLLCDYHYNNGPDPEPEPDPTDYQYTEEFDDDDPDQDLPDWGQDPDNPGIFQANMTAAADAWVESLPYTVRNQAQVFINQFIAFYQEWGTHADSL